MTTASPVDGNALKLPTRVLRKLTVRPVRAMEVGYWYPIRKRATHLPPLSPAASPEDGIMLILTTPRSYLDAIWSGWSHLWYASGSFHLVIACDGPPPAELVELARRVLPGSEVIDATTYSRGHKSIIPRRLAESHPLMTKLELILAMQKIAPILYSDSDVLMLGTPHEIRSHLASNPDRGFHLRGEARCEDPWLARRATELGFDFDPHLNSGLMWIPQNGFDPALAVELLHGWREEQLTHFTEQNTFGVLVAHAQGVSLPEDRYVANAQRMFYFEPDVDYDAIACRHFVNLIRNLMYSRGLPRIWRQAQLAASARGTPVRSADV